MEFTWFHKLASPPHAYRIAGRLLPWFAWPAGLLIGVGIYGALFLAPADYQQGDAFRIAYVHAPSAWLSMLVYGTMAAAAGIGLVWAVVHRERFRTTGLRRCLLVALVVWSAHNLIDINVYFGSIGAVGAALAGLFFWRPREAGSEAVQPSSGWGVAAIGALKERASHLDEQAGDALVGIGPAAVPALIEAMKDDDPQVRLKAASALTRIAGTAAAAPGGAASSAR